LRLARNIPKRNYFVFTALAVFVLVVAQPIKDLSAVSITHQAVGIGLPRLWCEAQASGGIWRLLHAETNFNTTC